MPTKSDKNIEDIQLLLDKAQLLCFPKSFPSTANAAWLLEGGMGSAVWRTQNSGKEFYDGRWRNTKNIYFESILPGGTLFNDPVNIKCFEPFQKWAFASRSGWLFDSPSPKAWAQSVGWGLGLVSWIYLKREEFLPQEYGFSLLEKTDFLLLMEELATGNWAYALRLMERSFIIMYGLAYGTEPVPNLISNLPEIPSPVAIDIYKALKSGNCIVKKNQNDHQLISRRFLSDKLGCSVGFFNEISIRRFLRRIESLSYEDAILTPGRFNTPHPSVRVQAVVCAETERPSQLTLNNHAVNCVSFISAYKMTDIKIPKISLTFKEMIKDLKSRVGESKHQRLIPLADGLALLNEAALWVTRFGEDVLRIFHGHLADRKEVSEMFSEYSATQIWKRNSAAYEKRIDHEKICESFTNNDLGVVKKLGLNRATSVEKRVMRRGDLTLSQALFVLIGACAYAIAMMKPMREGELEEIPLNCVLVHNQDGGCFIKIPYEKGAKLGLKGEAERPIPYLTYKAIRLLQKLADITTAFFGGNAEPARLFYFPGMDGFSPPVRISVKITVDRCMDYFCEYVDLPLDEFGRRHYYRTHELRKFFLVLLVWSDRHHGWEAGAWMAIHKNPDYMQAYTEANLDGVEISSWEAEFIETKILELEISTNSIDAQTDLVRLYESIKRELKVDKLTGLPSNKLKQYVKNALDSGRYIVEPFELPGFEEEFGVIIKGV